MAKGVSIYDIARIAGVSAATVSNVLNQKGRVSEKTKELVLEVARREGYVASFAAKSLRESRTRTIGLVTPDVSNDFFSNMILHAEGCLREVGYGCFVCDTRGQNELEDAYLNTLVQKGVDGILFIGGAAALDPSRVPKGMPLVCVDRNCQDGVCVGNDTNRMLHDMTAHLLECGCKRIVYVNATAGTSWSEDDSSYVGYAQALAEAGIAAEPKRTLVGLHRERSHVESERMVSELIYSGVSFDGVVAMGDRVALGVYRALATAGIHVGDEVRLIGMDNSLYSQLVSPSISSVERHTEIMARRGAQALISIIEGERPEENIVVPHEVIARETTLGPAPHAAA